MTGFLAAMGLERLVEFAPDMGPTTGDIKIAQGRGARIGLIAIADDNALLAIESFQGDSMAPGWGIMVEHDRPVGWTGVLNPNVIRDLFHHPSIPIRIGSVEQKVTCYNAPFRPGCREPSPPSPVSALAGVHPLRTR